MDRAAACGERGPESNSSFFQNVFPSSRVKSARLMEPDSLKFARSSKMPQKESHAIYLSEWLSAPSEKNL